MTCAELEILICEYVDGTLAAAEKAEVERHLSACPACAELARDSQAAVAFMERAADVEPPPELITRILFDPPWVKEQKRLGYGLRSWLNSTWLGAGMRAVLQPRVAMGMALTILSFSMLSRLVPVRKFQPEDLQPARVWASLEDRSYRLWARSVKFYENLKFVYQVQSTLREWQQQQQEDEQRAGETGEAKPDAHKLEVNRPAETPPPAPQGK